MTNYIRKSKLKNKKCLISKGSDALAESGFRLKALLNFGPHKIPDIFEWIIYDMDFERQYLNQKRNET